MRYCVIRNTKFLEAQKHVVTSKTAKGWKLKKRRVRKLDVTAMDEVSCGKEEGRNDSKKGSCSRDNV